MMRSRHVIFYVHGMGGGGDSRIPNFLKENLGTDFEVFVRTYDFNPVTAHGQLQEWYSEIKPDLVIGESMGAVHAVALKGCPHLFVSPSLNAPLYFDVMSGVVRIPGLTKFFDWYYHPKPGDRQRLHFDHATLAGWKACRDEALQNSTLNGSKDYFHAFFGTKDKFRPSGVVSIRTWIKYFGSGTYTVYKGTHFMEEEYLYSLLIPKIHEVLGI